LIGGETAEMPGLFVDESYDAVGAAVGAINTTGEHARRILPYTDSMRPGDVVLALASSGPHSNGYSLVRKIVERSGLAWDASAPFESGKTLAEALLAPTRIYAKALKPLFDTKLIKGLAHITGGGLVENTPRALPDALAADFDWNAWKRPAVFEWLQATGGVPEEDMRRTFNLGIGMALIVDATKANDVIAKLNASGESAFKIGELKTA
jgi:phosphoribosylaminoimidazole synthetase